MPSASPLALGHQQASLHGSRLIADFLKLYVFAVLVVEDLALVALLAVVDNRYVTVRSHCLTGGFFLELRLSGLLSRLFLLLGLLLLLRLRL